MNRYQSISSIEETVLINDHHSFIVAAGQVVTDPQALAKIAKFLKDTLDSRKLCEASVTSQVVELSKHQTRSGKGRRAGASTTSGAPGEPVDARLRVMRAELRAARSEIQATWLKNQRSEAHEKSTAVKLAKAQRSLAKAKRELKRLSPLCGRLANTISVFACEFILTRDFTHHSLNRCEFILTRDFTHHSLNRYPSILSYACFFLQLNSGQVHFQAMCGPQGNAGCADKQGGKKGCQKCAEKEGCQKGKG